MRRLRYMTVLALLGGWAMLAPVISEEMNSEDRWVKVYGWLQTGTRLRDAELWPLALGSFIESHRQLKLLKERDPDFEPEMVGYRLESLEREIAAAQEKLQPGEQEIMQKYLDFIDSYEEGMRLRFANQFVEALNTLDIAKVLLDEIIFEKPEEFRDAVDSQYLLLHDSLGWLDSQINFRQRSRPAVFVGDGVDWGTTQYVEEADLPAEGDAILVEGTLFAGLPAMERGVGRLLEGKEPEGEAPEREDREGEKNGEKEEDSSSRPAFRMSSKQKEIPELPEEVRDAPEGGESAPPGNP